MNYLFAMLSGFLFFITRSSFIHASEHTITRRIGADTILKDLARAEYKRRVAQDPSLRDYLLVRNFLNHLIDIQKFIQRDSSGRTYLEVIPLAALSPNYLKNPAKEGVFLALNKNTLNIIHRWGVLSPYKTMHFKNENDYVFFLKRLLTSIDAVFVGIEYEEPIHDTHSLIEYTITNDTEKKIIGELLTHEQIDAAHGSINKLLALPWEHKNGGSALYQLIQAGDIHSEIILPPLPPFCSREFKSRDDCRIEWHYMAKLQEVAEKELL